jgi:hypothetical protein
MSDSSSSYIIVREVVSLDDPEYFCNKSWTLSFNFNTKSWVSFHSYIPNWYIGENNFFYSGLNTSCDIDLIAAELVYTTTTTTTMTLNCDLEGGAVKQTCTLGGEAVQLVPPLQPPIIIS